MLTDVGCAPRVVDGAGDEHRAHAVDDHGAVVVRHVRRLRGRAAASLPPRLQEEAAHPRAASPLPQEMVWTESRRSV
jgi:hypothetical protein